MLRVSRLAFMAVCLSSSASLAAPQGILWGVNDSGLEFGKGNKAGTNYAVPDPSYYLSDGFQVIRLPFQISRLAPIPGGALDSAFVAKIKDIVAKDQAAGAITVLDPHGYGFMDNSGQQHDILTDAGAKSAYLDLMRRLAVGFRDDDVAIGLMNEPHTGSDDAYAPIWNDAIAAIREAGFHGTILVPHAHWSSASDIRPTQPFTGRIVDPDRNWVLELHLYFDPDNTGTYRKPVASITIGAERLAGAIAWSRQAHVKLLLGETGGPADPTALGALSSMLADVAAAPDVFWGITLWGAGPWWKPSYPMRLDPVDGVMRPQLAALQQAMSPQTLYLAKDPGQADPTVAIIVDGHVIDPSVRVVAARISGPQTVAIRNRLAPGDHVVTIQPNAGTGQQRAYVIGASWRGETDSSDAFGVVAGGGYTFHIHIPG